jgi:hypothetical protein
LDERTNGIKRERRKWSTSGMKEKRREEIIMNIFINVNSTHIRE